MINRFHTWLEGLCSSFPDEQPEKPPTTLSGFVSHYTRPFLPLLLVSGFLSVVIATFDVLLYSFIGDLVDWLTAADKNTFWDTHKTRLITIGVVVTMLLPLLKFLQASLSNQGLLGNYAMRTRWQAHRYLLRQSMEFFQNDFAGRVATKMMQTALGVRDAVMKMTEVFLYVVVYFSAAVVLFASSDIRLTAPMILWLFGYIFVLRYFLPRMRKLSMMQADARSDVTGRVVDSYTNIETVKMFSHSRNEDIYAREGMDKFLGIVYQDMRLYTRLIAIIHTMNGILIFSVGCMSLWLWHSGAVTAGAIAFAMGLVLRMQGMSQWVLWELSSLFENIGVIQDGIETIARDRAISDAADARDLVMNSGANKGEIYFDNMHFNYGKERSDVKQGIIENLNLRIKPGEKIGLVGRSGAGKSTLVSLLLRFYDIEDGRITIDGQDISKVTQDSLRSQIGMVTQDTSLLHRSVMDNIRYSTPGASLDEVKEAARKAHAYDFIETLEDLNGRVGYDAHVGERGVKLSGGQRQRVAIARVLLKNAPILILDEATSALDSEIEAAIQESLFDLMEGKTVIAIAHRLSTIAALDRLIIMDEGKIVEEGSHEELLERGGLYADLWARQSGGFLALNAAE